MKISGILVLSFGLLLNGLVLGNRSIDGSGNNVANPDWGQAGVALLRVSAPGYMDGISVPAGMTRKSARAISNFVSAQSESIPNVAGVTSMFWQWGQFLDHDIDLTPDLSNEFFPIAVPLGDPFFDPESEGGKIIPMLRSISIEIPPRQQLNLITAFHDASNVYGSDPARAAGLRTFSQGKLKTSNGDQYLPYNVDGYINAGGPDPTLYFAGDIRANEQVGLTAMHTLFVREHNRWCDDISDAEPGLSDEEIYQRARKIVGAEMQVITYQEFLPLLLGPSALAPYAGYDDSVNPGISNEFSTAAYRFGHTMLPEELFRMNMGSKFIIKMKLKDAFFNPKLLKTKSGVASILYGLTIQAAEAVDTKVVDAVRNFLFGEPGQGGFDLVALNIQRGRDHGLSDYNSVRQDLGLAAVNSFADITSDPDLQMQLADAYDSVDDMDLWVAGLAEDKVPGALVGETFHAILQDQFQRLRDGDRFWVENDPFFSDNPDVKALVLQTTLSKVIEQNTKLDKQLPDNVFLLP